MEKGEKRLSYEELKDVCSQLSIQSQKLAERNKELSSQIEEVYKAFANQKLEFLLNIINNDSTYFTKDFKEYCAESTERLVKEFNNDKFNPLNTL